MYMSTITIAINKALVTKFEECWKFKIPSPSKSLVAALVLLNATYRGPMVRTVVVFIEEENPTLLF